MIYLTEARWLDRLDLFRSDILHAMDKALTKIYAEETEQDGDGLAVDLFGARDEDLPVLFKALDVQFTNNMAYLGFALETKDAI
jgi:hypothetical protein